MHTDVPGVDGMLSYGGYCFPKDTNALLNHMKRENVTCKVLEGTVLERNEMRQDNVNVKLKGEDDVEEGFDEIEDEWNTGVRLRGQIGDLGLQFTYTDRINPEGAFRWRNSGVDKLSATPLAGFGPLLAASPFEPFTGGQGIWSTEQWFEHASAARLDGLNLQTVMDDFPMAQAAVTGFYATANDNSVGIAIPEPATHNDPG